MSKLLYHIIITVYVLGIKIASLWNDKAKKWLSGRKYFPKYDTANSSKNVVWMHCASLGEFEQGRPVIERIKKLYPDTKIVVTFFSPSGYEVMKKYQGANYIFYLPVDSKVNAKRFIDNIQPTLVIWVKYDFWFHYLTELKNRNIPVLLVSGIFRKDQPFFKWYGGIWKQMLKSFTYLFVQNEISKNLLLKIHITKDVSVIGDTRFDRVIKIAEDVEPINTIKEFIGDTKVIVAGSTWTEDDEELDHYANTHPEISFIIAPHEIAEERLKECLKLYKKSMLYSQWMEAYKKWEGEYLHSPIAGINCIIIDNIGMLNKLYRYATVCYVGGGFGEDGIHNILEAAVYGKPVIFGPVHHKYLEAGELIESGGGDSISCALELEKLLDELLNNQELIVQKSEASKKYVQSKAGATKQIIDYIQKNRLLTS